MEFLLKRTNIVILAKHHNPSIISKEWLTQKKIVKEEIKEKFVHTPALSLIETDNFTFVVDSDRLQITVKKLNPQNIESLPQIAKKYISHLPETPYTAMGFNFVYHLSVENAKRELDALFSPDDKKFKKSFSENYQLGTTIRFKLKSFIVKIYLDSLSENNKIIANFNFHSSFENKSIEEVKDRLAEYSTMKGKAEQIIGELFNG